MSWKLVPELASLEKSACVSPTSASQSEWIISVGHIYSLLFKKECRLLENTIKELTMISETTIL